MVFRERVKLWLRMCGHAMVSTVHERLNGLEASTHQIIEQSTHLAGTQTALLQFAVNTLDRLAQTEASMRDTEQRLSALMTSHAARKHELESTIRETEARLSALMVSHAAGKQEVESTVRESEERLAALVTNEAAGKQELESTIRETGERLAALVTDPALRKQVASELREISERVVTKEDLTSLAGGFAAVNELLDQSTELASTGSALLQSGLHMVQSFADLRSSMEQVERRLAMAMRDHCASREDNAQLMSALMEARTEAGASLLEAVGVLRQNRASLEPVILATSEFLENQTVRQVCIETSNYVSTNPELGLLEFLYSYLPSRKVLDIGAHAGDVSERLLNTGYEVYAFEPSPENYSRLSNRLGGNKDFHSFNLALGSMAGEFPLHKVRDHSPDGRFEDETAFYSLKPHGMPDDLRFEGTVPVKVCKLADLHREGLVPTDIGFVKIDTEGFDAEVVRGMGDHRYPAVMVEFWDEAIPFASQGLLYTVSEMVREMRDRGYHWYIVIYRVWGKNETAFFCNHDQPVPHSWGNLVFFQQREIFDQAQGWCLAALPRTYFKHVPATAPKDVAQAAHAVRA